MGKGDGLVSELDRVSLLTSEQPAVRADAARNAVQVQEAFLTGPPPLGPGAPAVDRLTAFGIGDLELLAGHLAHALDPTWVKLQRQQGYPVERVLAAWQDLACRVVGDAEASR